MKTTYVVTLDEIQKMKIIMSDELEFIDYFLERKKLIRWYKSSPKINLNQKFFLIYGLIDISFSTTSIMNEEEAKKIATRKNTEFLIKRKFLGETYIGNINAPASIYRVVGEDVKNQIELINEYHLVFDEKIDDQISIIYLDFYHGNTYDYLKQKKDNI